MKIIIEVKTKNKNDSFYNFIQKYYNKTFEYLKNNYSNEDNFTYKILQELDEEKYLKQKHLIDSYINSYPNYWIFVLRKS